MREAMPARVTEIKGYQVARIVKSMPPEFWDLAKQEIDNPMDRHQEEEFAFLMGLLAGLGIELALFIVGYLIYLGLR